MSEEMTTRIRVTPNLLQQRKWLTLNALCQQLLLLLHHQTQLPLELTNAGRHSSTRSLQPGQLSSCSLQAHHSSSSGSSSGKRQEDRM
jgi:hypothetical protein